MRIAIVVCGSRGDVQPTLAIAAGLRAAGHGTIVCSSPDNGPWARSSGSDFEAIGDALRGNPALGKWGMRPFNRFIRRQLRLQVRDLPRVIGGCDVVVASGLVWGVRPVAEHLGIPYRYVAFTPAGLLGTTGDPIGIRLVRAVADRYADLAYGPALNRARAELGLARVGHVMPQLMGPGTIAATDRALTVLPRCARLRATQTGYPILAGDGALSEEVRRFLAAGPPPVYAGFGSMPYGNRNRIGRLLVEAAERARQRLVIYRGWARIPDVDHSEACLLVDEEPHDLLFPNMRAVIHHGGAGTVATAARAGVPQIVLPQAADQFLWRSQVVRLGLGPQAPMLRFASVASLAKTISAAVTDPTYRRQAENVAERLRSAPDGVAAAVAEITGDAALGA